MLEQKNVVEYTAERVRFQTESQIRISPLNDH